MQNEEAPPSIITKQELHEKNEIIIERKETKKEDHKIEETKKEDNKIEKIKKEDNKIEETKKEDNKIEEIKKEDNKEESPNKEKEEIKYLNNLFGDFEFDFFDDILKPDCTYIISNRIYLVFFDLKALYNTLEEKIKKLFDDYPKNLENLKEPLENYMTIYQKEEYKDETSSFGHFIERIKFIFCKENYNRKVQERAIKMAFLFCQLKSKKLNFTNESEDTKINIGFIDSINYKIEIIDFEDLQKIHDEVSCLKIRIKNIEEINKSLQLIEDKIQKIIEEIENKYNEETPIRQSICKLYLLKEIDSKLKKIEASNDARCTPKTFNKMRYIRSDINKFIKDNILPEKKKLFFDLDLEFKIIKNTNEEKKVLLDGIYINNFFDEIKKNFNDLEQNLFKFDKDELQGCKDSIENKKKIIEFLRGKMEKLEKWESLEKNIDIEINEINFNNFEQVIEGGKDATLGVLNFKQIQINNGLDNVKNVGQKYYKVKSNNIVKAYKEKTKDIIKHNKKETIKLIKEYELIDSFEKQRKLIKDESKINGYVVSKKICNPKHPILDVYSIDII